MQFSKIAAAISFFAGALASPVANPDPLVHPVLAKRAEGIHLVNCGNNVYSEVIYCPNDSDCNHNPSQGNQCIIPRSGGVDHWEGSQQTCTFSTGTTFSFDIDSDAQSQPNFSLVGHGSNSFHSFNIFKDDQHVMFTDGNGLACRSIYYCLDA